MERQTSYELSSGKGNGRHSHFPGKTAVLEQIFESGHTALKMLLDAANYAQDVNHSLWDFSLEIDQLSKSGLAHTDLRWLLCKGYLEQAEELDGGDSKARCFHPTERLSFNQSSCFILTEAGQALLQQSLTGINTPGKETIYLPTSVVQRVSEPLGIKPIWDRDRQELRVGARVVKQFKVPAPNQEIVLAAFHEEDWPVRIDDPLPPRPELEPKRRLHDTINSLNRNQKSDLLRFLGDGSGQGVRWEFGARN